MIYSLIDLVHIVCFRVVNWTSCAVGNWLKFIMIKITFRYYRLIKLMVNVLANTCFKKKAQSINKDTDFVVICFQV